MDAWQIAGIGAGGVVATIAAMDYMFPWIKYDIATVKGYGAMLRALEKFKKSGKHLADVLDEKCRANPQKPFLIFGEESFTYEEMDRKSNQVANLMLSMGFKKGDAVSLFMYNCPDYVWITLGMYKAGIKVSFLNHNLRQKSLFHCAKAIDSKLLILGGAIQEIQDDLDVGKVLVQGYSGVPPAGMQLWNPKLATASEDRISRSARAGLDWYSHSAYIYTSGTTGLPKPAIISQNRIFKGAFLITLIAGLSEEDVLYTALPLYHSAAGIIALCGVVCAGATLVLARKFSATHFWEDCRKNNVTVIQYIGELCRYLIAKPKSDLDTQHTVRLAVGNGLRTDVWEEFKNRFNIPMIVEFYAATGGNAGFCCTHNKPGAVGRLSPLLGLVGTQTFVKYDFATAAPVRDKSGFCVKARPNETGLLLIQIRPHCEFDGYQGNESKTSDKLIRDVFKKGDVYFNSGDLFSMDKDYFVYFADRIGDTFRWKGENVSTIEVANVIGEIDWTHDVSVYGVQVPGQDGRAGMAALTLKENSPRTDLSAAQCKELFEHLAKQLPRYAVPLFLRIQKEFQMTSTFKQVKMDLVKEGFNPSVISDALYYQDAVIQTFVPLDQSLYQRILTGASRL